MEGSKSILKNVKYIYIQGIFKKNRIGDEEVTLKRLAF